MQLPQPLHIAEPPPDPPNPHDEYADLITYYEQVKQWFDTYVRGQTQYADTAAINALLKSMKIHYDHNTWAQATFAHDAHRVKAFHPPENDSYIAHGDEVTSVELAICHKQGNPVRFFTFLRTFVAAFNKPQTRARLIAAVRSWLAAFGPGGTRHGTSAMDAVVAYRTFIEHYKRRAGADYPFDRQEIFDILPQNFRIAVADPGDLRDAYLAAADLDALYALIRRIETDVRKMRERLSISVSKSFDMPPPPVPGLPPARRRGRQVAIVTAAARAVAAPPHSPLAPPAHVQYQPAPHALQQATAAPAPAPAAADKNSKYKKKYLKTKAQAAKLSPPPSWPRPRPRGAPPPRTRNGPRSRAPRCALRSSSAWP